MRGVNHSSLMLPFTAAGEDTVIVAGAFAREARKVRFIASLRASLNAPVYSAKIANSFQRLSGGRLAWHLSNEVDPDDAWHGQHWSLAEQIARTGEFLDVARGFWNAAPFSYQGKYYEVLNGGFPPALQGVQLPRIVLRSQSTVLMVTHDVEEAVYLGDLVLVMEGKPGRISRRIEVALPRPRDRASPSLRALEDEILAHLIRGPGGPGRA